MPRKNIKSVDVKDVGSLQEDYMNKVQLKYFEDKLQSWKKELLSESMQTVENLREENWKEPDITDRANIEVETNFELKTRNRYRKLIDKIEAALNRISKGTYGYCDETGEPIGFRRLDARPIATLSIEAQERHERFEHSHNED